MNLPAVVLSAAADRLLASGLPEASAAAREMARESSGALSESERRFAAEAEVRGEHPAGRSEVERAADERGWTVREEIAFRRRGAARALLRDPLSFVRWDELLEAPWRGQIAAGLYGLWESHNRDEPFVESRYAIAGAQSDLAAAMAAQGTDGFEEACAQLGRRLVSSAIDYVLSCHERDAEAVLDDAP